MGNNCGCGERREYMTLGEYMELYPTAYAEATEQMTERQKRLFELRFRERLLFLPKDETSEQGETLTITANISADTVTPDEDNPIETTPGGSFFWRYDVSDDAEAPIIAVEGAQYVKTADGSLYVYDAFSNVSISVQAALKTYPVTITAENGTATPASATIQARGTAAITITPDTNYELNSVNASGATMTRDGNVIILSNPTGAVTVAVSCTRIMYNLLVTPFNCTFSPKYTQVAAGGTYAITFVANAGYDLPEIVQVSGAQYSWKQATGVLTIYNPTDTTIALVRATAKSYSITANITNGTANGANTISTGQTVALTIAANDGYDLPDTITVTGATGAWNKTTGTLSISNPTGNVTVTGECVAAITYPAKGDTIQFDEDVIYRVIKIYGSIAEVMRMTYYRRMSHFSGTNEYENSPVDYECNTTYYGTLSSSVKIAIVDKTITQTAWNRSDEVPISEHYTGKDTNDKYYYLTLANPNYGKNITRKCYCLSVQDVLDYLGTTKQMGHSDTTLTTENLNIMFSGSKYSSGVRVALTSADSSSSKKTFVVDRYSEEGSLKSHDSVAYSIDLNPAFQIDLSKVEWRKT